MAEQNVTHILNLVGELNSSLAAYFEKMKYKVVLRHEVDDLEILDYIIVSRVEEAKNIAKEYDTVKNEIKVVCFEPSNDIREFLISNGRLIVNENLGDDFLSQYIIDKFFGQEFNIHLDETFQDELVDLNSFKITNHLATGFAIDQLTVDAFNSDFNLVPIRSFVDHVVYYFTYLKQAGLAGIPFEFEYGHNDDCFVVNVHASVKNFVAEYMIDSFGVVNAKDPLSYLLGVASNSCDFLDLTYIEDPGKIILTGFFSKSNSNSLRGLSFNNILTTAQVNTQVEEKIKNYISQTEKTDELNKKQENLKNNTLPGGILEMVTPPSENSIFNDDQISPDEIIEFMVQQFGNEFPNDDISTFNLSQFNQFSPDFINQDLVEKLSEEDIDFLVERVQKHQLAKAYNDELLKVRELIKDDDSIIKDLQDTIADEVSQRIADHVDVTMLNSILANTEEIVEKVPPTMFGDFKPSIPNFSTEDAFSDVVPAFADIDSFDTSTAFDSFAEEIPVSGPDFSPENLEIGFGVQEDTSPGFEVDSFSDLLPSDPEEFPIAGMDLDADQSTNVSGGVDEDAFSTVVSGGEQESEWSTTVSGGEEEADDFMQKISGMAEDDDNDFINKFSSGFGDDFTDDKYVFKSSSPAEAKRNMHLLVQSTLENTDGLKGMDLRVKSFVQKEAPEKINAGLDLYAQKLGKTLDDLTGDDLDTFGKTELPGIMTSLVSNDQLVKGFSEEIKNSMIHGNSGEGEFSTGGSSTSDFDQTFKDKLESKLAKIDGLQKQDDRFVVSPSDMTDDQMQSLIKDTMKETFDDVLNFTNASPDEIDAKENMLIKSLAGTLNMSEEDVSQIVKGASNLAKEREKQIVAEKLYNENNGENSEEGDYNQTTQSKVEATLIDKLKGVEDENKKLKTTMSAMELKLNSSDAVKEKFDQIVNGSGASEDDIIKITSNSTMDKPALNVVERKRILEDIAAGTPISPDDADKLKHSLEKENEIIELAKAAEKQLKIAKLESEKKDAMFKSQLEKAQKAINAKEIILAKAKEAMKNAFGKKEKELGGYKSQVNELNKKLSNDQSTQLKTQLKAVSQEKESLAKSTELYKGKLDQMLKNVEASKSVDNSDSLAEENRGLKKLKNQFENKLNTETKLKRSLEDRFQKAKLAETKARTDAVTAQTELKTNLNQLKLLKDQNTTLVQTAAKTGGIKAEKMTKELNLVKANNIKLQEKVVGLNKQLTGTSASTPGKTIEASPKVNSQKLEYDLEKSGKEVDHLKDQNQKLQLKIAELNKKYKDTPVVSADPSAVANAQASKDAQIGGKAKKEVEVMKTKNDQLQAKVLTLVEKLKKVEEAKAAAAASGEASPKEKRLEQSVKKMNAELTRARTEVADKKKESMKNKTEVTGLKNQLAKAKKDLEKAEKAISPKGKKKAA